MRPPDKEPESEGNESLPDAEERTLLDNPIVPDEVKSEINERLERHHDEELGDET